MIGALPFANAKFLPFAHQDFQEHRSNKRQGRVELIKSFTEV
jgi:hypothetical protein